MQTILGANGVIGYNTAKALRTYTDNIRLVSRNPRPVNETDHLIAADLTNFSETKLAVQGSEIVYLTAGLNYNTQTWQQQWPVIMQNVVQACKESSSKLVFFDNVYAYGYCQGKMTEETPFNPCSNKGEVRAQIAQTLLNEMQAGNIEAMIVRSADFYGPNTPLSFVNMMVFENMVNGKRAQWMLNETTKHSFTYTPDAGFGTALLGNTTSAFGQTWHLPTHSEVLTGKEIIELAATALAVAPDYQLLKKWMLQMVSLFNPLVKESMEMLYQLENDYLFDSSKFEKAFRFEPTSYRRGVVETIYDYQKIKN
jgi:nucleoside-diphosphate-sugar epimerase